MTICLFIGGPAARKLIDVDPRQKHITIPVLETAKAIFHSGQDEPTGTRFNQAVYVRSCVTDSGGRRHTVYVQEGIDCPIIELMSVYANGEPQ